MILRDARGRELELPRSPQRLISLVPSTTETLFALGLGQRLVGRTHFCVRPSPEVRAVPAIGGTKTVNVEAIQALKPDLVLANMEENRRQDVLRLEEVTPVWVSFPRGVSDALTDIRTLGEIGGARDRARRLVMQIGSQLGALRAAARRHGAFRCAYLIWRRPYMTVNGDTFVSALLAEGGGENVFGAHPEPYPSVTVEEIGLAQADVVFLPSEPYNFLDKHRLELAAELGHVVGRMPRLVRVPGDLFCWHGVRLVEGLAYYRRLLDELTGKVAA